MTYASTIPTLKANLKASIDALAATSGNALYNVQVSYGAPVPNPEREYVWIGDADGDQEWAAIGHLRREEDYILDVLFQAIYVGVDQQQATERVFQMAAAVETSLRADPTVAGAVRVAGFGGPIKLTERVSVDGTRRGADLLVGVRCQARM